MHFNANGWSSSIFHPASLPNNASSSSTKTTLKKSRRNIKIKSNTKRKTVRRR